MTPFSPTNCAPNARRSRPGFGALAACALAAALSVVAPAAAAPVKTAHVEAELVAAKTAIVPGESLLVALRLKMAPGWHTYWQNPGDSGLPTTIDWKLPPQITAGAIEWPAPELIRVGPLANFGYDGEVLLLTELAVAKSLAPADTTTLNARADWLVCKEICIPEGVDLALALPVAGSAAGDSRWDAALSAARAALPKPLPGWQATAQGSGQQIALTLKAPADASDPGTLLFFSYEEARVEPSPPQKLTRDRDAYVLQLPVASTLSGTFTQLSGVVTAAKGFGGGVNAMAVSAPLTGSIVAGPKPALAAAPAVNLAPPVPAPDAPTLAIAVLFALLGGVVLNLMPCVFPVLSLKVLGFATHEDSKAMLRREAIAFAAGVIATFVALGLALAGFRAAGEQLGWGFQLQSPIVVTVLAMLFFVIALNLSGVFEFGNLMPQSVAGWSSQNRVLDAFGSGVLIVVIASPCTAPFMGAALGYALTGTAATVLMVFVALGIGMALPYVLLAWFPGWRAKLPRPGPWLARFKQLLAFPMYATVIWLAWVLGSQRDNDAVLRLFIVLLGVAFVLWAWRIVRTGGARSWAVAAAAILIGTAVAAWPLLVVESDTAPRAKVTEDGSWMAFTPTSVGELTASGRAVFVDFTAAWCVTCQVNKRLVLNTESVRAGFARRNVALVRADWTRRDATIAAALAALGRNGVPVYVLYRPGKEPLLLPEVLQQQTVLDALATL